MLRRDKPPSPLTIARIAAGLKQSDVAVAIDKSTCFVSRIENGKRGAALTPEIAERFAAAIGTPAFVLFKGMQMQMKKSR